MLIRRRFKIVSLALLELGLLLSVAQAQEAGSVQQGHRLAQQICAECHLVDDVKGRSSNAAAPTFGSIARVPGLTAATLTATLQMSHRSMPNIIIKGSDSADIVAYILSLKGN